MPSRRRTRRAQPTGESRVKSARRRKKIKNPQKPRFIRRYIRQKEGHSKTQLSHSSYSELHISGQSDRDKTGFKPFKYGLHDIAPVDKKTQSIEPIVGVTSVPDPTPDTGLAPATSVTIAAGSPLLGAIIDTSTAGLIMPVTTALPAPRTKVLPVPFSPLPPLLSVVASGSSAESRKIPRSSFLSPVETGPLKTPNDASQSAASKSHSINLVLIILLGVGSALLLLGSCILIKLCTRPRRQERPKPSLPIFKDADPEDDFFETKESPIFGGKERLSPMNGSGGPTWTWVQYPHEKLTQPALAASMSNDANRGRLFLGSQNSQKEFGTDPSPNKPPPLAPATSYHTTRRQPTTPASIYAPRSYANIGQAITNDHHEIAYNADGQDIVRRTKSKTSPKRRSQLGRDDNKRNRESTVSTIGLAYDAEDVGSPGAVEYTPADIVPTTNNCERRERIKSGYFATGTYPRISTMPSATYSIATATRVNVGQRTSFHKEKLVPQNPTTKRQRDTQALTFALGLATPETNYMAQSPQPTLYPDDSMSFVDTKRQKGRDRKSANFDFAPDVPVIVPDMPQTSGLMTMDFRVSQMSLSELTTDPAAADDSTPSAEDSLFHHKDRSKMEPQPFSNTALPPQKTDQPPRVPSPPPLPSLAQMSLANYNPETYANYRSPTYSLYGLYEKP